MTKLRALFDACEWTNKVESPLPENARPLYIWREHEAPFAGAFFGPSGSRILKEEDLMVVRHLHYWETPKGVPTMAVIQENKPITNLEEIAASMARTMDVTKIQESWARCAGESC